MTFETLQIKLPAHFFKENIMLSICNNRLFIIHTTDGSRIEKIILAEFVNEQTVTAKFIDDDILIIYEQIPKHTKFIDIE